MSGPGTCGCHWFPARVRSTELEPVLAASAVIRPTDKSGRPTTPCEVAAITARGEWIETALKRLPQPRRRNPELLAVLGHGPPGDLRPACLERLGQGIV